MSIIAMVEGGGTKFLCALGEAPDAPLASVRIDTTTPEETLGAVIRFFEESGAAHGMPEAIGIACFGPVDCDPTSPRYGYVQATTKPGWVDTDIVGPLKERFSVPVSFETDVGGATLGEGEWGAGQGFSDFVYITVGTGIGAGAVVGGRLLRGLIHPEMGHMTVARHGEDEAFEGICAYHGACVEGLASGPAIEARWGQRGDDLPSDHPAWALEAFYLAQICVNLTLILSPQRIILGGGVMNTDGLIGRVRAAFAEQFNDYMPVLERAGGLERYIVTPELGDYSALYGAFTGAHHAMGQAIRAES